MDKVVINNKIYHCKTKEEFVKAVCELFKKDSLSIEERTLLESIYTCTLNNSELKARLEYLEDELDELQSTLDDMEGIDLVD